MNTLSSTFQRLIIIPLVFVFITCDSPNRSWSNPNDPKTDLDPSEWAPSNLQAQVLNDSEIKLTWEKEDTRISGFRLERSTGGNYTQIAEVEADITEFTDTGLNYGTDYTYRVKAFTDANESGYTNIAEMTLFYDCTGLFMGNAVEDCAGDCNGTAYENVCGCVGGSTGLEADFCYGCTDPEAFNFDPHATINDGSCYTVTDIDGNVYQTVIIGDQEWMAENLKVTHYRNGDVIPTGLSDSQWSSTTAGAYAVYDNNESNTDIYGRLYNWYAVADSRNIAPEGWHVPTDDEWTILTDYLGGSSVAGGKMKEAGTSHWNSPNTGATNESGFTALPGGYRYYGGGYYVMGSYCFFWSSTESNSFNAWDRVLSYDYSDVNRNSNDKQDGFSVRVVRTVE